jgi:hypothetical protein
LQEAFDPLFHRDKEILSRDLQQEREKTHSSDRQRVKIGFSDKFMMKKIL